MMTRDILLSQLTDAQRRNLDDVTREAKQSKAPVVDIVYDVEYDRFFLECFYHLYEIPLRYSDGDCDIAIGIDRIIHRHP